MIIAFLQYHAPCFSNKLRKVCGAIMEERLAEHKDNMKQWTREERYRLLLDAEEIRPLHGRILRSEYRQTYHIQPVTGLLNDPNGFIFHNGRWHLFYQWCPWGAVHGLKYWYHTSSDDLIHWKNLGACIRPDSDFDNKGAYSGSALPVDGSIYLYYTGNHRDEDWTRKSYTCLAVIDENGRLKKKDEPLFGPNEDYTEHQRDPKIIYRKNEGKYLIMIGAQTKDRHGCVIFYESDYPDRDWHFRGQLNVPGFESFGDMWECPSVEQIAGKDVLIFCPQHLSLPGRGNDHNHNGYLIGRMDWETLTFTPEGSFHVLDFGFDSYAAECASNIEPYNLINTGNRSGDDKAVIVAWMGLPDSAYPTDDEEWQGCLTLPRELTVHNRRLIQKPLDILDGLRDEPADVSRGVIPDACEMIVRVRDGDLNLNLFTQPDGSGGFRIIYDSASKEFTVDRSQMKTRFNESFGEQRTRVLEESLSELRIFIDRSSVEIFVNDGEAVMTSRVFPQADEHGFTYEGNAAIRIWSLKHAMHEDFVI